MVAERFALARDFGGNNTMIRPAPAHVDVRVLAASTNESHTPPTGADLVVFSSDGTFYARPNATAAVPGADVTDGTGSEMNPVAWELRTKEGTAVTAINLIAPAARIVTMSFYKLART